MQESHAGGRSPFFNVQNASDEYIIITTSNQTPPPPHPEAILVGLWIKQHAVYYYIMFQFSLNTIYHPTEFILLAGHKFN